MWFLIQTNETKTRFKYLCSKDDTKLLSYIKTFPNVKRIDTNTYQSNDIIFYIRLGEEMR